MVRCGNASRRPDNIQVIVMTNSAASHMLPVFARVDLAFERGEGAWLIATDGERYLDFASRHRRERARPRAPAAGRGAARAGRQAVAHLQPVPLPDGEQLAERLCERPSPTTCSSAIPAPRRSKARSRSRAATTSPTASPSATHHHLRGRLPRPHAGDARRRRQRQKYLEGFGPPVDGFDHVPFGDLEAVEKAIGPRPPPSWSSRSRARAASASRRTRSSGRCAQLCDEHGLLLIFDEIQSGMGRTGKLFAYEWVGVDARHHGDRQGLGGGFPIGACLATEEAATGMTPGTHGSTFGGNPLAMAVANAVLDVMLEPGFLDARAADVRCCSSRSSPVVKDAIPTSIDEVRGKGLLHRHQGRGADRRVVDAAARRRTCSPSAAGDNVVRLLPPLIVDRGGDRRGDRAVERLERACAARLGPSQPQ